MDFLNNDIIRDDLEELKKRNIPWDELREKTVLVTGAYGMIASYIVFMCIFLNEVYAYNIHIIVVVRDNKKLKNRFGRYVERNYFIPYFESMSEKICINGKVDYIIHAAGHASQNYFIREPIEVIEPNISGTLNLLNLAEEKKAKSFLLFSSGEVYGRLEKKIKTIREENYGAVDSLEIRNCYCESKRMAEMLCRAWHIQKKTPVKIARICHTYGPTVDINNDSRVFAEFILNVKNNKDIHIRGDGKTKRPFTYIADAVAGYFTILFEGEDGQAYNVCNEEEFISIKDLAEIVAGLYPEKGIKVIIEAGKENIKNETVNDIPVSSEKLELLGWKCKYDTKSGFYRTAEALSL